MHKAQIPLIALAVFSIIILLANGNIEKAFAIGVISDTYYTSATTAGIGYNSALDYLLAYQTTGTGVINVLNAGDLTSLANITLARNLSGCVDNKCMINIGTNAYFLSVDTSASPDVYYLHKLNLNTFAITSVSNNTASINGCIMNTPVLVGTAIYTYFAGASCSERGWYNIDYTETDASYLVRVSDGSLLGNVSVNDICSMDSGKIVFTRQATNFVYFTNIFEAFTVLDIGTAVDRVYCVSGSNVALVSSDAGNDVNTVNTVTGTLIATTSVTGAKGVIRHGNDMYVSDNDNNVTICNYSATASMVCSATIAVATDALFIDGNSTRFNALNNANIASPIAYAIFGLPDDGSDSGGSEIVSGVNCALPENQNTLLCALAEQEQDGITGASVLVNQSSTNIICQVGLLGCTQDADGNFTPDNPDIKTNGIGYLLTAIAMGIFVGLMWVASRGNMTEIPTFVWFIGTLGIVGGITAIQWIDPTFLVITVIAIVAMAVAKAKGVFGEKSQLFAGEG